MEILDALLDHGKSILDHIFELSVATTALVVTAGGLFLFAIKYGKDKIIALIFSLYIGLLIFLHFPYTQKLLLFKESDSGIILSNVIVYAVMVLLVYIVVARTIGSGDPTDEKHPTQALILALTAAALLLAFAYNVIPLASFYHLSPALERLFSPSGFFFWWLILPLVSVFFLARR